MKQPKKPKIRKEWGVINPATTRIESKKLYSRKSKHKKSIDI
jgi:hypothetical protein